MSTVPDYNAADEVLKALGELLAYPDLKPSAKILTMILILKDEPLTAQELADAAGLTPMQVHHALRPWVTRNVVHTHTKPSDELQRYVTVFQMVPGDIPRDGAGPADDDDQ